MGINNLFSAGGVVMIPLLGFSVLALALIVERISFWIKINNRQTKVVRDVLNLYRRNNVVGFNCSLKIWEILEIWARFTRKIYDVLTKPRPNFHPNELIWTPKSYCGKGFPRFL